MWKLLAVIVIMGFCLIVYFQDGSPSKNTQSSPSTNSSTTDWHNPRFACSIFSDIDGMQTSGYKQDYGDRYICLSPYKEFDEGFPLKNNLAYYVTGTAKEAKELKLVLNVHVAAYASGAHEVLLSTTRLLVMKSLGVPLPDQIKDAILAGKSGEWKIEKSKIGLARSDWETGKGYDLKLRIQ